MPLSCPHCDHRLNLKSAKPGRYRPRCPKCEKLFALTVQAADEFRAAALQPNATVANRAVNSARTAVPDLASQSHIAGFRAESEVHDLSELDGEPPTPAVAAPRPEVHGYRTIRELGRGGMGTVFLAQQLSLDRPVALKIMAKRWASDPVFVARFTREAFAAAQLRHPNIVHIHDIGDSDGGRFFSMEYVPGRSLADVVRKHGKLDPEIAVGYILQAARGLKHAHDRGMIHRDVKPENLLLDEEGLVKVADLGLVKTAELAATDDAPVGTRSGLGSLPANMTGVRIALGTPAYMSPEQCRDATAVDHRADIYSLGCTLYVLVTGRPPFQGTTAVELMTKQAYEPIVPPERIAARVPAELSAVIQRMMAKSPEERPQTMDEVVRTLEAWLGIRTANDFLPQEEQIAQLEGFVQAWNHAPKALLRTRAIQGFTGLVFLAALLLLFFGRGAWSIGVAGLLVQSALAYFVLHGIAAKGLLFTRTKQFVLGLGWWDRGLAIAGVGLFALLLAMTGTLWIWLGFGVLGIGLACVLHFGLDRAAETERRVSVDACAKLLRRLRVQGLDEEALRQFTAKFAGRNWEGFFEALFGYEAKLEARATLLRGGAAGPREKHAAWREPLLNAMSRIETIRKESRERKLLAATERARLLAEGAAQTEAERQAKATADALVKSADRVRIGGNVGAILGGASDRDFDFISAPKADPFGRFGSLFVGAHVRAVLAAVLLASFGLWAHQNGLFESGPAALERSTEPLRVEGVPAAFTNWADGPNAGIAGLLLLASLGFRGNAMAVLSIAGSVVVAAGHHMGIRTVESVRDVHISLLLGSVLVLAGFRLARR
ncbi:MAG: serine/threonine-protein kinase [Gemmataceae bacterium]